MDPIITTISLEACCLAIETFDCDTFYIKKICNIPPIVQQHVSWNSYQAGESYCLSVWDQYNT